MEKFDWGHWSPPKNHSSGIPDDTIGFVYKITDSKGKYYIGCKQTTKKSTRKPLKGKTRKRIVIQESDWRNYCSSSGKIAEDVKRNKDKFKFEILSFHDSKSSMKLEETKQIIENIYDPLCWNEMINIRIRVAKK
jgi:hypothetical protein